MREKKIPQIPRSGEPAETVNKHYAGLLPKLTSEVFDLPAAQEGQGERDVVLVTAHDAQELKLEIVQRLHTGNGEMGNPTANTTHSQHNEG